MRRRAFLLGGAAVALVGAGGLLSIRSRQRRAHADNVHSDNVHSDDAQTDSAHSNSQPAGAPGTEPDPEPLFPPEDWPLLLAVADVIVPREGDLPAASEIDLLPKLESWARGSASRLRTTGDPQKPSVGSRIASSVMESVTFSPAKEVRSTGMSSHRFR